MNFSIFKNPYNTNNSIAYRLIQALLFGTFVFLFLIIFKPFHIDVLGKDLLPATIGFGTITFLTMILLNVLLPQFFRPFFNEEKWTVGREVFYTLINIWLIGLVNFLFFNKYLDHDYTLSSLLWFQFSTVAVGIFPVLLLTLIRENRRRAYYTNAAGGLNKLVHMKKDRSPVTAQIVIPSQDAREDLTYNLDDLLYLKSADNYVEVHYDINHHQKVLVRNTLKEIEKALEEHAQLFRCHKSYLVNLDHVERVSGNAQGYKLHLIGVEQPVPVSRKLNETIRNHFANHP